jgi:hydrogenase maturation protease
VSLGAAVADDGADVAALLIFGYGNPSRGDDALGPLLLERLEPLLDERLRRAAGGIELLTDFQLQVEHALDLAGRRRVLFVDAHQQCEAPFSLTRLQPAAEFCFSTHALSPAAVLKVYQQIYPTAPPASFLLGIRGERFALGEPLSAAARRHLDAAVRLVATLCATRDEADWQAHCTA